MAENNPKMSKLKLSGIMLAVSFLVYMVLYVWVLYQRAAEAEKLKPKPMIGKMIGALKAFHQQVGRYPEDFREVNKQVWKYPNAGNYGQTGREITAHRYFYFYEPVDHHTCMLWALPLPSQGEASSQPSFFLVLTPEYIKNWRGPALDVEKAKVIKQRQGIVPTLEELEKAGLIEQKAITKY